MELMGDPSIGEGGQRERVASQEFPGVSVGLSGSCRIQGQEFLGLSTTISYKKGKKREIPFFKHFFYYFKVVAF